jgi:hypothetical protein
MVFHEYAKLCIRTLDNYKMMDHQYPVFVLPFLFQTLFLYSSSGILLQSAGLVILGVVFSFFGYKHI